LNPLLVDTPSAGYNIYFAGGFSGLPGVLKNWGFEKICVISDSNVSKLYLEEVKALIGPNTYGYVFEAGERNKNLDTARLIYEFLINNCFDRKSLLIALGGGVTGDLVGFVAATYMRGISYAQAPTTLLAQIDSSVGGKTGVDFLGNKNLIGAFYQPKFVYTNINALKTLDKRQFASGMAEVIKHGLIMGKPYYEFIIENKEKINALDFDILQSLIFKSCEIKKSIVRQDEKESGLREILNFGHTFGHAFETLSGFQLTHGHSVAIGMVCSAYYALQNNYINEDEYASIINILKYFGLYGFNNNFNEEEIISQMYLDKKTKNNVISIITLKGIGGALIVKPSRQELSLCINRGLTELGV
jgi:3-dehydroquinate synthase